MDKTLDIEKNIEEEIDIIKIDRFFVGDFYVLQQTKNNIQHGFWRSFDSKTNKIIYHSQEFNGIRKGVEQAWNRNGTRKFLVTARSIQLFSSLHKHGTQIIFNYGNQDQKVIL
jgi:hypothetical protein